MADSISLLLLPVLLPSRATDFHCRPCTSLAGLRGIGQCVSLSTASSATDRSSNRSIPLGGVPFRLPHLALGPPCPPCFGLLQARGGSVANAGFARYLCNQCFSYSPQSDKDSCLPLHLND